MRKGICIILVLLLLSSMCTTSLGEDTLIASGSCGDNAYWSLDKSGKLLIWGKGVVVCSDPPWEMYKKRITSIEVMEGITRLAGSGAFELCTNLVSVKLPSSLSEIPNRTFRFCENLMSVIIPDGITKIEDSAFDACNKLTEIDLPSTLTIIDHNAFANCGSLKTITIPENVTTIGNDVFRSCYALKTAYFLGDTPKWNPLNGYFHRDVFESNTIVYYRPEKNGWSTPVWGDWTCYPICERGHKDENGELLIEELIESRSEYTKLDDRYHRANLYYKFVCSDCHATVTMPIEFDEKHNFVNNVCEMCDYVGRHNTLESLTEVDFLAFSSLAYKDVSIYSGRQNVSIYEMLMDDNEWNEYWEGTDIRVSDLFGYIRDWEFVKYEDDVITGFSAIAFRNDKNEIVIAYRGSVPFGWHWLNLFHLTEDWILNDLLPILGDIDTPFSQYNDAVTFYSDFTYGRKPEEIAVTGHSLGGGLANVVSAYSGSRGVAFNGVSILDTNYFHHPKAMSKNFTGIEAWNYVDHVNEFDVYAGMWEVGYKNAFIHQSIDQSLKGKKPNTLVAYMLRFAYKTHGLSTIAYMHSNGEVALTTGSESKAKYNLRELGDEHGLEDKDDFEIITQDYRSLYLGNTTDDIFQLTSSSIGWLPFDTKTRVTAYVAYGGDGDDIITTYRSRDTLIGGPGNDYLDGGTWGDDLYIYNKGDGLDYIVDTVGDDEIYLQGFDENDVFQIVVPTERQYVYYADGNKVCVQSESQRGAAYSVITCNGEPIICVDKNRADNIFNTLTLNVGGTKRDITSEIQPYIITIEKHYEFHCPIDIDILDADGNVVYTLKDSQLGNFYNDYGNFYVLPNEDSQYNSKIIDLFEGYTIKIRGIGEGEMGVLVQDTDNYELLDACGANEVPITPDTVGTLVEDEETGITYLLLDSNGDGTTDETIPLSPVHFEAEDHDSPMELVPGKAPTCVEEGVAQHYLCSCGRTFRDAEAKEEITDPAELVLPATGLHTYVKGKCSLCGEAEPRVPQTGDRMPLYALCVMPVIAAAVLVSTLRRKKKA